MKNLKKIAASVLAAASLAVSMTGISSSAAAEPRYGGSKTFYAGNIPATATIDRNTSGGTATTTGTGIINFVSAMITVKSSSGGSVSDIQTNSSPKTVTAKKNISNCVSATSSHTARSNAAEGKTTMAA